MLNRIGQLIAVLGICFMISGCAIYNSEYYIPVENQAGDAQPLSKNDVIRVAITHNYLDIPPPQQPGWMNWGYFIAAKRETEKRLQNLNYDVIDVGDNSKNDGHPTVIALVDSSPIEGSATTETHTWDAPVFTDDMGRTTLSEKQGVTITHKAYYYKVKLVRPEGKDNPLFTCLSSRDNMGGCIAPANPSGYKTIYSSYATISTDNVNYITNVDHLVTAVFYNYPNMMGKKWVYFTNTGYTPLYATDPNAPKPTDKK
ncbi:hypothetical protein [Commensalibacter papalotli (ex Botero et al. 2024)]|uniref:Lipoprotein n=2 Tax=Commensalibacter papalotli (ex Botero et al. 2024) TaxID=2972766 RepID=A0ABM9HTF6_9PROT|nr:hypothetical protein [Commensalibacter papalotli (ex Botero et al. 2024)]CAI3954795.1 unnamed protein product [Commensalibacter papalotli (ex Botero et al. 2024)]CAI3955292.1 unnamed protein product [Commensalibacter papalotli (ex Botero et al. 2024)]